ncbi:MAG: arylsulfatase [Bacteroidaceae bacterium]|nr:arylsulfatase [Bacteroidaceae bacterium]
MDTKLLRFGLALVPAWVSAQKQPNIVFILCDDMGWGDLGCYGQRYIETPNIDRMAREGMQFMQAYAGSPVSAPSRASLMTGQHTGHCEIRGNKEYRSGVVEYNGNKDYAVVGQHPLDTAHVVLPEILKRNGYRTAQFGKWAGGYEGSISTPDKRGVDEFYGYICQFEAHTYYPNFLNKFGEGDKEVTREIQEQNIQHSFFGEDYYNRPQYSADVIHRKAMDWLERQDGKQPFYGLFTYTIPHAELVQPQDSILAYYKSKFSEDKMFRGQDGSWYHATPNVHAQFAAMITRLDKYVGEIMEKLEEKGLSENTILIFSSDNGPHEEGGADPTFFNRDGVLRGIKRSCHEGGIRIPFIVRWPGHVPAQARNNHPIAFYDIMPTFCDIVGEQNYVDKYRNPRLGERDYFDGISFLPTLMGKDAAQRSHDYLYWEFNETDQIAVRQANWKLIVKSGRAELYDLAQDIHEDHDVAAEYPHKVMEMIQLVHASHVDNPHFHVTLPD